MRKPGHAGFRAFGHRCSRLDGAPYMFRNRRATRIKVLMVDAQGAWLPVRRWHQGRFVWPSAGETLWV